MVAFIRRHKACCRGPSRSARPTKKGVLIMTIPGYVIFVTSMVVEALQQVQQAGYTDRSRRLAPVTGNRYRETAKRTG